MRAALGRVYAESQKKYEANKMLNELNELAKRQYVSAYEVAKIYVALGNNEQAFQLLTRVRRALVSSCQSERMSTAQLSQVGSEISGTGASRWPYPVNSAER